MYKTVAAVAAVVFSGCGSRDESPLSAQERPRLPVLVGISKNQDLYHVGDTITLRISVRNPSQVPITLRIERDRIDSYRNWWNRNWKMDLDATPMRYPNGLEEYPMYGSLPHFDVTSEFVTIPPDEVLCIDHSIPAKVTGEWDFVVMIDSASQKIFRDIGGDLPLFPYGSPQHAEWAERWRRYRAEGWERSDDPSYVRMKIDRSVSVGVSDRASIGVVVQ